MRHLKPFRATIFDVGTNINQVCRPFSLKYKQYNKKLQEALDKHLMKGDNARGSIVVVATSITRCTTRQQFEQFGEDVNELLADVNVDIEGLRAGQLSKRHLAYQVMRNPAAEAAEERRDLQHH